MDALKTLALLLGTAWTSGINLYATVAVLGLAHRLGWIALPGSLDAIAHPLVIGVAVLMYAIEFMVDKIPYVDSAWDSLHTFIRPLGGATLAYLAMSDAGAPTQLAVALASGTVALDAHLVKATSRLAINASPEPATNISASVTEDVLVLGALWLAMHHPFLAALLVVIFLAGSIWFLRAMWGLTRRVIDRARRGWRPPPAAASP